MVHALSEAARGERGVTLVGPDDAEQFRSYAELERGARRRALALRQRLGLERGDRVVVILNTSFEFIEVFFGVLIAGGVPVPAYPPLAMARLEGYLDLLAHIATLTRARLVVTDAAIGATLGTLYTRCPRLERIVEARRLEAQSAQLDLGAPRPESTCFIQCTSGSTSTPKAVVLSHRALVANIAATVEAFELADDDVYVSWAPLYHDMGLIGALLGAIVQGIPLVLIPPDRFVLDPGCWWRAISRHRGTVTAAPNFAYGLTARRLDAAEIAQLDLRCLRIALCGAEPIQPATVRAFCEAMAPAGLSPRAFYPAYGLAESCVAVTLSRPGDGLRTEHISRDALARGPIPRAVPAPPGRGSLEAVSVGRPVGGTRVRVVDAWGRDLPDRRVGELWVESPSLMTGYLDAPRATAGVMVGNALRSGDLGYRVGEELFVVGRLKNMLIVRGRNYYAEDIEHAAERVPGVRRGNAVAYGVYDEARGQDELHVVAETRLRRPEQRQQLQAHIRAAVSRAVGLVPRQVVLVRPGSIPKTSSGKKRRTACRERVAAGIIERRARGRLAVARTLAASQLARLGRLVRPAGGAGREVSHAGS